MTAPRLPNQRAIIERRALAETVAALHAERGAKARPAIVQALKDALARGRAELERRLVEKPAAGHEITGGHAFLIDQLVRVIFDHAADQLYPAPNRSSAERIAILAVGGYGRAEMAPHSDVDIAFLTPQRDAPWCEQVIEAMLYLLWDLGLKVGHSSRTPSDMVRMAKDDLTIRTALLEGRYVWGDEALYEEGVQRFRDEVVKGTERLFVTQKLAERNARHKRMGDSRYVVEPNVKEGKGGLRDLQTLYWIGKYIHRVRVAAELVDVGLFTKAEYQSFRRAEGWLLAVRCHLHSVTDRAEDRLTFDLQRQIAERMNFADRPGKSAVERFMQFYFLQAKRVGALTGIFLAHIDEEFAQKSRASGFFAGFRSRPRHLKGYVIHGGRIAAPSQDWFAKDPVRLVEIFQLAEAGELEVHPETMRLANRESGLIDKAVRHDPRANALFLDVLAGRNDPESALRWMNEANVFGRFVPDFGRVNAQMQFDMYHHYTVDEHTIRAIGLLAKIEKGQLEADHPRATRLIHKVGSRRVAYVAALLHDIAKGRGGDHSVLGAEVAERLCPRFGLSQGETEMVAWLVKEHLLMSATAFKRDLTDPKTIEDFVARVQSAERLRHLAILTAVDIRAVGPGVWNSWKGQLLGELYDTAQEQLRLGHARKGRGDRVASRQERVAELLGPEAELVEPLRPDHGRRLLDRRARGHRGAQSGRLCRRARGRRAAFDRHHLLRGARGDAGDGDRRRPSGAVLPHRRRHPPCRRQHHRRAHPHHARGWAIDNFLVQDPQGGPFREEAQLERLRKSIADALANRIELAPKLAQRPLPNRRSKAFEVRPRALFDNKASGRFTVIEVNARDRPALLNRLARALFEAGAIVHSAHITAYGERAADTFYVTDATGSKLTGAARLERLEAALVDAASDAFQARLEDA